MTLRTAALVLVGLSAVAITQPLLDILGRNAEFFVAGRYGRRLIVALAVVIAWLPAALATTVVAAAALLGTRVRLAAYRCAVITLSALFALAVMRNVGVDFGWATLAVAGAAGIAVAAADSRVASFRIFLRYLAVANLGFLASFLFLSRSSDLLTSPTSTTGLGEVVIPHLDGPVVVIVLDEFPVTTLLRPDGTINEQRFPNIARLAETSTWFRNASSHSARTHVAVPQMLTGRIVDSDELPTYREHPRNLLTLFGDDYPVERYEVVTDLCPPTMCDPPPPGSLRSAIDDSLTVYGHLVMPANVRHTLPDISHSWGDFGDDLEVADAEPEFSEEAAYSRLRSLGSERSSRGQARVLVERAAAVTSDPAVHLIHVALPHYTWTLNQSGLMSTDFPTAQRSDEPLDDEDGLLGYQLHTMQVGATDRAIGEVTDDLRRRGVWDDALVAIVSDHGTSLSAPDFGRAITDANREEVLRVPMFIKAPGQTDGEVRDDVAMTIDLLPSIVDLLDVRTDWQFDGHSLFDGSAPTLDPAVSADVEPAFQVAEAHAAWFGGEDWTGLAGVGDHRDLVGAPVADLREGAPSELAWSVLRETDLADLPTPKGAVPYMLAGSVTGTTAEPPQLVVALNGRVAGTIPMYRAEGGRAWQFSAYLADFFVDGVNDVEAFEVELTSDGPVLHELSLVSSR